MKRWTVLFVGMGVCALLLAGFGLAKLKPQVPAARVPEFLWRGVDINGIVWGPVTTNLRMGVVIERARPAGRPSEGRLWFAVQALGPGREEGMMVWMPTNVDERFDLRLVNHSGVEVARTARGRMLGKQTAPPTLHALPQGQWATRIATADTNFFGKGLVIGDFFGPPPVDV